MNTVQKVLQKLQYNAQDLCFLCNGSLSWHCLNPYMYSCHGKFLPSIFFSFDLCICSQLMLNLLAFRAKMSFTVTLGDPVTEQLDHLVAVALSPLR